MHPDFAAEDAIVERVSGRNLWWNRAAFVEYIRRNNAAATLSAVSLCLFPATTRAVIGNK
jgi:hypothetical protein